MRTGEAVVRLDDGSEYEGVAEYDGRALTLKGHRRNLGWVDGDRAVTLGTATDSTWPIGRVAHVRWQA